MKITSQKKIVGKEDSCTVARNEDGSIYISSIRIQPTERDEFIKCLAEALEQVNAQ